MASRFVENLDTTAPITHPHLNVSLDDILAEEGRKRSSSHSSESSQTSGRRSGSDAPTSPASPTAESKMETIRRRALTLGSKKGRRTSWSNQESRFFFKKKNGVANYISIGMISTSSPSLRVLKVVSTKCWKRSGTREREQHPSLHPLWFNQQGAFSTFCDIHLQQFLRGYLPCQALAIHIN